MNENWDDDVRADMSDALDGMVKEDKGALEKRVAWKEERFSWGHQSHFWIMADGLYGQPEKESTGTMQRGAMICRYISLESTA